MTSRKQVAANRKNALKSSGPRTWKGKVVSGLNALKHGLQAERVLLPDEDPDAFHGLHERLFAELAPEGTLETQLVERMAVMMWRLRRVYRVEAGLFLAEREKTYAESAFHEREHVVGDDGLPVMRFLTESEKRMWAFVRMKQVESPETQETAMLGFAFSSDSDGVNAFSKLSRYETAIERSLYRTIDSLRRIQAERKAEDMDLADVVVLTVADRPSPDPDKK